jgi:predicted lipase
MSTGHSLGAGLSLMTNLDLSQIYSTKMSTTYNYGCLRIGNAQFANYMKLKLPTIFRVVHNKDPVPHVPPFDFSYQHPAYEVLYD